MVKVSIVVPVYNSERYIGRCLDSLINQTLQQIEIITVNDASPDDSIKILKKYEEKYPGKIVVIDSKENLKPGGARNLGLDVAKGEYIGFVDSDDWVENNMYEELYNKAKENDTDIVDSYYTLSKGPGESGKALSADRSDVTGVINVEKRKKLLVYTGSVCSKIYKKSFLKEYNLRFPSKVFYEDNEFVPLTLLHAKSFDNINKSYYHYFKSNENSITKSLNDFNVFQRLETAKNVIKYAKEKELYETYKNELDFMFIRLYYSNTIGIILNKFKPIPTFKLKEMKKFMKEEYPEYYKNIYYQERISKISKKRCRINDISPNLLVFIFKVRSIFKSKYEN